MGADTQSTCSGQITRNLNECGYKVARLSNGMLLGICGRVKAHQLILSRKCFDIPADTVLDKRYIVKHIIPALSSIADCMKEEKDTHNVSIDARLLLAWKDRLFYITNAFEVLECSKYAAIGAGEHFANYALASIGERDDVNEGLIKALRAGAYFHSTVSAPFVLIDTRDREYRRIEG